MAYLLLSPSPPLALQHHPSSRRRSRRGAVAIAASSSSSPPDGSPSPSEEPAVLARRAVLLGASAAIPLVRLREAAATPTTEDKVTIYGMSVPEGFIRRMGIDTIRANQQTENCYKTFKIGRKSVVCRPNETKFDAAKDVSTQDDTSKGTEGVAKPDNSQPEGAQIETLPSEAQQPESSSQSVQEQSPGNPVLGLLNVVAVAASGVLAGLYGTSRQENKALQSVISSMESKFVENEVAYSSMKENYEKRLSEQQAAQKKQSIKFQEQEASLLGQLASTKKTLTSLSEEFKREKKLAEELRDEIQRLETNISQAGSDKDVLETKLQEKLATINMLQEKISSLSQELDDKERHIKDLSASLSSKEVDYQKLSAFTNETKRSLELANSKVRQLEEELHRTKTDLTSKVSLIDSLNVKLQALNSEKEEAEKTISELRREYTDLKADSETRASQDSKLLAERDDQIKQLEERLCVALSESSKDHETIAELNKELDATKVMLENELATMENLKASIQSLENALKDSRSEVSVLSKELEEANKSNQDLVLQISKLQDEFSETQEDLSSKLGEAESMSKALSDELVSVKEMVQKAQEELEATSSELASVVEARDNLKKELLDVYKNLESTTHELVDERKAVTTLNRELEALSKQLHADFEARKALEADLDEATKSLDEMNNSALSLSKELAETHSRNDTLEAEREALSKALAEQMKITTEAQENTEDAQNLITRLKTEKESFELRSRHLEEELALAKGEILRLRRQISANRSPKPRTVTRTRGQPEINETLKDQHVNDHNQNTTGVSAGAPASAKRVTRRRKSDGST